MSSREQDFAARLKVHLDRSAEDLRPGLAYRLQAARAEALARLEGSTSTVPMGGLAGAHGIAGGGANFGTSPRPQRSLLGQARFWIGILAIAAAAFGYHQWTVWTSAEETGDLDAELLSSELPIDAYLDRGFQNWLSTSHEDN
jgi:Protein of unknown function (DUF3619)